MKLRSNIFFLFFILLQPVFFAQAKKKQKAQSAPFLMREVLSDAPTHKKNAWLFYAQDGFVIFNKSKAMASLPSTINLTTKSGRLLINDKKIKDDEFILCPVSGSLTYQGSTYTGYLYIKHVKRRLVITHFDEKANASQSADAYLERWQRTIQLLNKNDKNLSEEIDVAEQQFTVRVLLEERDDLLVNPWHLKSKKGFMISEPNMAGGKLYINEPEIRVRMRKDGSIWINGKKASHDQLFIAPLSESITFNNKEYCGSLWVKAGQEKDMLINCIGIEDYVASVLCTESWPGWPLEMNKVLAIASRTYVIAMVQSAGIKQRPYHVKNTNVHQTYSGKVKAEHRLATQETKGLFLTYKNQPITAMFDACCGGIVPAKMQGVNFASSPYLARTKPCTYCKSWKHFAWQAEYKVDELEKILKKEIGSLKKIKDIKITKKDAAGLVHQVQLKGSNRQVNVTGKKIYSLLNEKVKSFCYTVRKIGDKIIFNGRGYGHHLGLCQWGAYAMIVEEDEDYNGVFRFFYPGTKLMRLQRSIR